MDNLSLHTDIALLRSGDEKAFERLYRHYWAKVYHFAALYLTDRYEQEEVVQQVFIRLWNMRGRLDAASGLDGLLFIMARNLIFNRAHQSLNQQAVQAALLQETDPAEDLQAALETEDLRTYVQSLLSGLPPRQRQAYQLSRGEGLSYKEIAARMGISEKGVERNISLALKFLRRHLPLFLIFMHFSSF